MVVQRTLNKIEELKERPHHERRTVALYIAVGVVAFITLFWGFFALRKLTKFAVRVNNGQSGQVVQNANTGATASAAAATDGMFKESPRELMASSSNGRVDLVPAR